MDLSLAFQLLVYTPLLLVPVLSYLIVGRLFKDKDRILKIISSLVISLAFASIIPLLMEWSSLLSGVNHLSQVFPWTDCNNEVPGACSCPKGALCDCVGRIDYLICRLLQYYEWALIVVAILFITASFLIKRRAKKKQSPVTT